MDNEYYECLSPVVLFTFNRPDITKKTFDAIRMVKPKNLILVSDGPRFDVENELELVEECRRIVTSVDWNCNVIKIFSQKNLGCLRRIVTGLDETFRIFDKAIIIEDDCVPTITFFKFMDWGLEFYLNNDKVGMISGSNLVSNKIQITELNGYSRFINIWGWATWKYTWELHNPYIPIYEIQKNINKYLNKYNFKFWQILYWRELFKFTIYKGSTWDFQLQYTFFKNNLLSVFPKKNLVNNIGFDKNSTHTKFETPKYVIENSALNCDEIFSLPKNLSEKSEDKRDFLLANTIWSYNIYSMLKLFIKNIFRFLS